MLKLKEKYKTILIDPPWDVKFVPDTIRKGLSKLEYSTMSIEEIRDFPIEYYADNDCVMFLWTIHSYLPVSLDIIKEWGFRYLALICWDKGNGMTWNGIQKRTELCLVCYKGKLLLNFKKPIPTIFYERSSRHSEKPKGFYRIIERSCPKPRIEIFARQRREGWAWFGNELSKDIQMVLKIEWLQSLKDMEIQNKE